MTANERLERLLNRAGQTISDLPTNYGDSAETLSPAFDAACAWFVAHCLTWTGETAQYILHLTDIIDRMEWALESALAERDFLSERCCLLCGLIDPDEVPETACYTCEIAGIRNAAEVNE